MANLITCLRIICGPALFFFPAFSKEFYILCLIGGLSDVFDGMIARKLNKVTAKGAKLDTLADTVFVLSMLIKVISAIDIPTWLIVWVAVIALIKVVNLISGLIMYKKFVAEHTKMNKATGVILFITLFCAGFLPWQISSVLVILTCAVATFAAVQEGHYIRTGREIS